MCIRDSSHTLITGPNGSGKSTLIGLMNGIYKPNNGEIKIFSDKFSYVGPVPLIFLDTLRNNLLYGVEETIEDSLLVNWINKYNIFDSFRESDLENTISSESLSSGQMQKISIIRALLRSPEILFLDEANLKNHNENLNPKHSRPLVRMKNWNH